MTHHRADWAPHRRESDDELVGLLAPADDGLLTPLTVFGHPLAGPRDPDEARAILDEHGLAALADPWLVRVDGVEEPVRVMVVEAGIGRVRVRAAPPGMENAIGGEPAQEWTFEGGETARLSPTRPLRR